METNRKEVKKQFDVEELFNKVVSLILILTMNLMIIYGAYRIIYDSVIIDLIDTKFAILMILCLMCYLIMAIFAIKTTYQFFKYEL